MKLFLSIILLCWISLSPLQSQAVQIFEGLVQDVTTQEVIPFATVALYNDSMLIDGISTDESGAFTLKTKKEVSHIEISFIGYQSLTLNASEILNHRDLIIALYPSSNTLEEVMIQAERTTTQLKIDRKIINIGSDLQQSGISALEAFDQIPEIQSDLGTGTISLRGSGNVRILINGKPSSLNSAELLQQIPTTSIDRVELITSPSAKHQASGLSGIINIILKKNLEKGLNLNINGTVGTKRHSYGIDGNYNLSWLNLRFNAGLSERDMDSKQRIHQIYTNGFSRRLYAPHDFNGNIDRYELGADISINETNQLSVDHRYTYDYHDFFNNTFYSEISNEADYVYTRNSSHTHQTSIWNTNYRKSFAKEGHFIELDYNRSINNNTLPAEDFREAIFLFEEERKNNNILNDLAVDYTLPITDQTVFEAGISWNDRNLQSTYKLSPPTETTLFDYSEDIKSIYTQLKFSQSNINWQVGLRLEQFRSNSKNNADASTTSLDFLNLFPSIHASYSFNENSVLNLGYSRRISRPNFHHINPFQSRNQYFEWIANPSLGPEFSNNVEINYQRISDNVTVSGGIFYRSHRDIIEWLSTFDEDGVQSIGFDNIGTKTSYGLETMFKFNLTKFWNTQMSFNYYQADLNQNASLTWDQLYSSNIISKHTFTISKSISTDLTFRHSFKNQRAFSYIDSRNRVDLAVRVKMLNNRLTANLSIVDLLDDNLMHRTTQTPQVTQQEVWRFQSQSFGMVFNLSYHLFQKGKFTRQRKHRDYEHGGATD